MEITGAGTGTGAMPAVAPPPPPQGGFCYLYCSLLPRPLRLNPVKPVIVGRGQDNDIVVPSQMISRRHGQIAYEGNVWVFTDLKSSNGSKVNGKRVERSGLQSGDVIDFAGFIVTYKEIHDLADLSGEAQAAEHGDSKTVTIDPAAIRRAAAQGMDGIAALTGISGSLGDMALPDVLQLLEMQRKSGTLHLDFGGALGRIYLLGGNMIHAEYGKITGETAIYKMVPQSKGSFRFDPREPRVEPTIRRPTTSVLLDASRALDEKSKQ